MNFYVIYSFDIVHDIPVSAYNPPDLANWNQTEDDELYEYDYLGEDYKDGHHRKYTASMDKEGFEKFVNSCGLHYEDIETMGSITEMGWMPAFSFQGNTDAEVIWQSAYVTPIPDVVRDFHDHFEKPTLPGMEFSEDEKVAYMKKHGERCWHLLSVALKGMFT